MVANSFRPLTVSNILDKLEVDMARLQQDYARTHRHERSFTYPTRASLAYHVRQMELDPDSLDASGKALLEDYLFKLQACMVENPDLSEKERRSRKQALGIVIDLMISYVISQMDIIACIRQLCH